jgi:ribulose-5-phosphate 4-epimerase/fuculose-1-phosphate aldolase
MRQGICLVGRRLDNLGFCPATSGNISVRLKTGEVLMTPSGVPKGRTPGIQEEVSSVNLVFVCDDPHMEDQYGRQIARSTSVVHKSKQSAPAFYWE